MISRDAVASRLLILILDTLGRNEEAERKRITKTTRLADDLGMDSIDLVDLVLLAEDVFDVDIDDAEMARVVTFEDGVDVIMRCCPDSIEAGE